MLTAFTCCAEWHRCTRTTHLRRVWLHSIKCRTPLVSPPARYHEQDVQAWHVSRDRSQVAGRLLHFQPHSCDVLASLDTYSERQEIQGALIVLASNPGAGVASVTCQCTNALITFNHCHGQCSKHACNSGLSEWPNTDCDMRRRICQLSSKSRSCPWSPLRSASGRLSSF